MIEIEQAEPPAGSAENAKQPPPPPARRLRISGGVMLRATADLDDRKREAIRWAFEFAREQNLTHGELAAKLRKKDGTPYSDDSLYHVFTGRREPEHLGPIVDEIERFRRTVEERRRLVDSGFIETPLSSRIWETCRRAFLRRRMTCIFGESQIGKTTSVEEFARRNPQETCLVRMPTKGLLTDFMLVLTERLNLLNRGLRNCDSRRSIMESLDDRMLLIVDEAHQCLCAQAGTRGAHTLDFVREIHDRRKCGVVLVGTNILRDNILRGPHERLLRQTWLRCYAPLQIPAMPGKGTMDQFSARFGLDPAEDKVIRTRWRTDAGSEVAVSDNPLRLQEEVVKREGLGRWIAILQEASDAAREAGAKISWGRVLVAHRTFQPIQAVD